MSKQVLTNEEKMIKIEVEIPESFYDCIKNKIVDNGTDEEVKEWIEGEIKTDVFSRLEVTHGGNRKEIAEKFHLK